MEGHVAAASAGRHRRDDRRACWNVHPHTLLDLAAHFVVFETRDGVTRKKLARYQQYRAANKIVERVLAGELDRGLVWHTTGSGKSLTMVFAARKLMRAGLERPTVFIVIDRTDLDDQYRHV